MSQDFFDLWQAFTPEQKQEWIETITDRIVSSSPGEVVLFFITDDRHGWVVVPKKAISILNLKVSKYSYQKDDLVFLEEDLDLQTFLTKMKETEKTIVFRFQEDGNFSRIRNFTPYKED